MVQWTFGIIGVLLAYGAVFGEDHESAADKPASAKVAQAAPAGSSAAPVVVTAAMIERKGPFWTEQSPQVKSELVGLCLKDARDAGGLYQGASRFVTRLDRDKVAAKLDAFYADKEDHLFSGPNADTSISDECESIAEDLANKAKERADRAFEASTEPGRFRATNKLVRRFFKVQSKADDLRDVDCQADRSSCSVRYKDSVGDLGKLGDLLFGEYNRDYERQLTSTATDLFKRLFSDKKFSSGTVTVLLAVVDVGGKDKTVPALTMSCDRDADRRISWDQVEPRGLRTYCDYQLANIEGLS
jgi:hypothetical protein